MSIKLDEKWQINGVEQFICIRADKPNLPILLYLHGGPGDAALPLVLKYNKELQKHFTLVIWEQRGAGKSYYSFDQKEKICIDTFVQDTYDLVKSLLERFRQNKIYLVSHSWGSVIGLQFCKQYPQLLQAYIGCGQVVNMMKSSKIAYEFAVEHSKGTDLKRLSEINCSYTGDNWLADLLFVTKLVVKHKGSLYGQRSYNKFVLDFLFSKNYSIKDLINRQKGSLQSIQYLWQELMGISFEDTSSYEVPIVFIEGRNDSHVSSDLAKDYFDTIKSPKTFHYFEKSCHFPQWSEAEKFNNILIDLLHK